MEMKSRKELVKIKSKRRSLPNQESALSSSKEKPLLLKS